MILVEAHVGPFRSMQSVQTVRIEPKVTVLVGMNEAGKTVFLKALHKSSDALALESFDPVDDFPRRELPSYLKRHRVAPEVVAKLVFELSDAEVKYLNTRFGVALAPGLRIATSHRYDNTQQFEIDLDETPVVRAFASKLSPDAAAVALRSGSLRELAQRLSEVPLSESDQVALDGLQTRIRAAGQDNVTQSELTQFVDAKLPRFLYFSEYDVLPGKVNLTDLAQRVVQAKSDPKLLTARHRAVLALLRMADVSLADLAAPRGYEELKAKVEAVSLTLTDQIMEFWKQNEDLEIEVDIKGDLYDDAPFNNGPNLYLRIKNRRHRGVSMPFDQRSRGFIWFFSFLVWFDSVQQQLDPAEKMLRSPVILLLDEPGLALHALAQADFLRYIDRLAHSHQVIYTTHSPFMIHADRLHQVRLVEDRPKVGTIITDEMSGIDARTSFPLQAALGWTLARNLLVGECNLLVDGPTELIVLRTVSSLVEAAGGQGLRDDITVVPVGGLDKVAMFLALVGSGSARLAMLHDGQALADAGMAAAVQQGLASDRAMIAYAQFRAPEAGHAAAPVAGIEDLLAPALVLDAFNLEYAGALAGVAATEGDLPPGACIVERLRAWIESRSLRLRAGGGFDRLAVARRFAMGAPDQPDAETLARFQALLSAVNRSLAQLGEP